MRLPWCPIGNAAGLANQHWRLCKRERSTEAVPWPSLILMIGEGTEGDTVGGAAVKRGATFPPFSPQPLSGAPIAAPEAS
jgi:hypothetical protein